MLFFQLLLILSLSYQIETRFIHMTFADENKNINTGTSATKKSIGASIKLISYLIVINLWKDMPFLILILNTLLQIYDFYLSYSLLAVVFNPLKTWLLISAIILRYKCTNLNLGDFEKFVNESKSNNVVYKANASFVNKNQYAFKHYEQISRDKNHQKNLLNDEYDGARELDESDAVDIKLK